MKRKIKLLKSAPVDGKWHGRNAVVDQVASGVAADLVAVGKAEYLDEQADQGKAKGASDDAGRNAKK